MSTRRERLTVTVAPELIEAGNRAVSAGLATSLSGWVNGALEVQAERDRKLQSLKDAVAGYESEFGVITDAEMARQMRTDRSAARVVRGKLHGTHPR